MNVKKVMKRMTGVILSLTMIMGSFSVQAADSSVNTTDTAVLSEQEAENPAESGQEILIEIRRQSGRRDGGTCRGDR